MEGAAKGLPHHRQLLPVGQTHPPVADGAPIVEAEAELAPQFARHRTTDRGAGAGAEADVGDHVELAGRGLGRGHGGARRRVADSAEEGRTESARAEVGEQRPARQTAGHRAGKLVEGSVVHGVTPLHAWAGRGNADAPGIRDVSRGGRVHAPPASSKMAPATSSILGPTHRGVYSEKYVFSVAGQCRTVRPAASPRWSGWCDIALPPKSGRRHGAAPYPGPARGSTGSRVAVGYSRGTGSSIPIDPGRTFPADGRTDTVSMPGRGAERS
jgi:hypothetical protein